MKTLNELRHCGFPTQLSEVGERRINVILKEGITRATLIRADKHFKRRRYYKTDEGNVIDNLEQDYIFLLPEQSPLLGKRAKVNLKYIKDEREIFEGTVVRADLDIREDYKIFIRLDNGFFVLNDECSNILYQ